VHPAAAIRHRRNAQRLFAKQEPREKRGLLNFLLSNCTWEDGEVVATFRQTFDLLPETAVSAARGMASESAKSALPGHLSNHVPLPGARF
jgi:site-specific DNA recombinase